MMITVCCAIILNNNKVLVAQRSAAMSNALKWEFPGGKLHANELPHDCIKREILEELGIEIQILKQLPNFITNSITLVPFICVPLSSPVQLTEHVAYQYSECLYLPYYHWSEADIPVVNYFIDHFCVNGALAELLHIS